MWEGEGEEGRGLFACEVSASGDLQVLVVSTVVSQQEKNKDSECLHDPPMFLRSSGFL